MFQWEHIVLNRKVSYRSTEQREIDFSSGKHISIFDVLLFIQ